MGGGGAWRVVRAARCAAGRVLRAHMSVWRGPLALLCSARSRTLHVPHTNPRAQAALIVAESQGRVIDAQGELITTQYFDSLAAEVNDMLQVRLSSSLRLPDCQLGAAGCAANALSAPLQAHTTLPRHPPTQTATHTHTHAHTHTYTHTHTAAHAPNTRPRHRSLACSAWPTWRSPTPSTQSCCAPPSQRAWARRSRGSSRAGCCTRQHTSATSRRSCAARCAARQVRARARACVRGLGGGTGGLAGCGTTRAVVRGACLCAPLPLPTTPARVPRACTSRAPAGRAHTRHPQVPWRCRCC
jgi:hypothetical protein